MTVNKITSPVSPLEEIDKINEIIDNLGTGLPDQTGQSGKYLTTDGTSASWGTVDALPSQTGNANKVLTTNGTSASWTEQYSRNIGEIVQSTVPLTDAGLHLLDGTVLSGSGIYADFVEYIATLYGTAVDVDWTRPNLSSNTSYGTVSTTNYGSGHFAWHAFDNVYNGGNKYASGTIDGGDITWQLPLQIKIESCKVYQTDEGGVLGRFPSSITLLGSNDGSTWQQVGSKSDYSTPSSGGYVELTSSSPAYYSYYKWNFGSPISDDWSMAIAEITITATKQEFGTPDYFCSEADWQTAVSTYGVCGKFVYDSTNNTVRLPKITGFTEGTITPTTVGDLTEAGLPNITGETNSLCAESSYSSTGAFGTSTNTKKVYAYSSNTTNHAEDFDASRSSSIYGNSNTVQPQSIKVLYYIVVTTSTKTDIQVDIDQIATDLNGKMDSDMSNMSASQSAKNTIVGWGLPDYSSGISISTGSYTPPSDGLIRVSGGNNVINKYIDVNGARAAQAFVNSTTSTDIIAFVQKGDSVAITGTGVDVYFYPLKGVV